MIKQQENESNLIQSLMAKNAILESSLAEKNAAISKYNVIISKYDAAISQYDAVILNKEAEVLNKETAILSLTADLTAAKFQIEQLQRMIFGSKRERFISTISAQQLALEFEPKTAEIEEVVKVELELIRSEYLRKKVKKEHHGRMALPSHLPVVETIIEPEEDTTGMVCIGKEITEELDYTPAKLHINRIVRPKYISKEDEAGNQQQVIAELNRPVAKCIASTALLAMIFTDKFIYHLPLYRIIRRIAQMGVNIPNSTMGSWVKLGADLIRPLYEVHRLHVFREVYQMIDESPIKVQRTLNEESQVLKGICENKLCFVANIL